VNFKVQIPVWPDLPSVANGSSPLQCKCCIMSRRWIPFR